MNDSKRREFWILKSPRLYGSKLEAKFCKMGKLDEDEEQFHVVELQPHERIFSREQVIDLLHDRLESYSLLECTEIADILFGKELFASTETGEK